jgi:ABC-type sugar transport system substrate-binding protein
MPARRRFVTAALFALAATFLVDTRVALADDYDRLRGLIEPVKANKPYRIAFAAVHFIDDYWKGVAYGILDEADKSGVKIVRILSAGGYGKLPEQISELQTLATLDLDAVIVGTVSFDGLQRPLKQLADKGTKIVAMDLTVNSQDVALRVGQNQFQIGEAISDYICQQKNDAKVITIPGPAGVEWTAERLEGVKRGAAKCGGIQLLGNVLKASTTLQDGISQASDLLTKYPDADYIYAATGNLGTGAAEAVKRSGAKAKVVTANITDNTVKLMNTGQIAMVISEPAVLIGRATLQYTIRLLNGDPLPNLVKSDTLPYPSMDLPPKALTTEVLKSYDLRWYDNPPTGWQVPLTQ